MQTHNHFNDANSINRICGQTVRMTVRDTYLDRFVLRVSQAVDVTEATEVRTVASADSVDVGTSTDHARVVIIGAVSGARGVASLSKSSSGDYNEQRRLVKRSKENKTCNLKLDLPFYLRTATMAEMIKSLFMLNDWLFCCLS